MDLNTLKIKPGREADRREHQHRVKNAIVAGERFELVNLLAEVRTRQPYENYALPDQFETFAFSIKGAVRLEMLNEETYRPWRRLFGSNTKAKDIPTWRSRVSLQAFESLAAAQRYIEADPLLRWPGTQVPQLPKTGVAEIDWLVLFQVRDVWLEEDGLMFSDLLAQYLSRDSKILQLVTRWTVMPALGGEK